MTMIRRGQPADCEPILLLLQTAFAGTKDWLQPPSGVFRETVATLQKKLMYYHLFVAGAGNELVGCVFSTPLRTDPTGLYFGRLAVLPAFQGNGIGTQLVARVEERARAEAFASIHLGVRIKLTQNVRYFQALGYEINGPGTHQGYAQPTYYTMSKIVKSV